MDDLDFTSASRSLKNASNSFKHSSKFPSFLPLFLADLSKLVLPDDADAVMILDEVDGTAAELGEDDSVEGFKGANGLSSPLEIIMLT